MLGVTSSMSSEWSTYTSYPSQTSHAGELHAGLRYKDDNLETELRLEVFLTRSWNGEITNISETDHPYLQVMWQSQQRSVQLRLIDACAVPQTLHPQHHHVITGCDDVGAHIRCAALLRKQGGSDLSCKPQEAREEAKELNSRAGHAIPAQTLWSVENLLRSVSATGDYENILNHQY